MQNTNVNISRSSRVYILEVLGSALLLAGVCSAFVLFSSIFARYMFVEDLDLQLDETTISAVTKVTPADEGLYIFAAVLVFLGVVALISAAVRRKAARKKLGGSRN